MPIQSKGRLQMQTSDIETIGFSEFLCNGCGMAFSIMEPKEICPACCVFFCESCIENGEYERHKEGHGGNADGGESPNC